MRCSRALLLLFCSRVLAFGALTVSLEPGYPTQTTAVFAVTGFTGGCTWEVSKSNTYSPVVDDVDATVHSGANVDTSRSDTFTRSSGTVRVVTIGHNVNRRALATDTTYYYRVSGCGRRSPTRLPRQPSRLERIRNGPYRSMHHSGVTAPMASSRKTCLTQTCLQLTRLRVWRCTLDRHRTIGL